jgi:hypothetical protein
LVIEPLLKGAGEERWARRDVAEIHPADALEAGRGTVVLPVSRRTVAVEAWKRADGPEDLPARIAQVKALLSANELEYGDSSAPSVRVRSPHRGVRRRPRTLLRRA